MTDNPDGFDLWLRAQEQLSMTDRIAVNPQIHFGKPCVGGTRIPVQSVLELVPENLPFADIFRDYYPELTSDDVRACIQYASVLHLNNGSTE
jgi:uncharacterized protein (DUF433 family)